jgi:hypothetical protein
LRGGHDIEPNEDRCCDCQTRQGHGRTSKCHRSGRCDRA